MRWNGMVVCACVCALCAVSITCGCVTGEDQASPTPAAGPPAGNTSGPAPGNGPPAGNLTGGMPEFTTEAFEAQLAEIEALGFDLSEVRAAMDAGDQAAAQEVFRQFIMEHRDELPEGIAGPPQAERAVSPP
jgi:hypothetical protein